VFEEVGVKQQVFGEIEKVIAPDAILATNTSSLSVEEIGAKLEHPERLVGFHFFNPVAVMPLIEIVKTQHTTPEALSTAFVVARGLGKNAVLTADAPGFVVNRLLAKVFGEAARALYEGTPLLTVEKAFEPLGLPMKPFQLIDLVGWKVAAHVQDTMAGAFPDRFYANENFHVLADLPQVVEKDKAGRVTGWTKDAQKALKGAVGDTPASESEILRRVQDGLAREIRLMLDEGVVPEVEDIDLCLILGAGWPFIDGGASPYLDREGASERVFGATFHTPVIRGTGS
jgi:3-hydroxyacyl-CoA dehydrogenase